MNTLRVSYGLPALIEDPIVNAVAQSTAATMAANNMSWHIGDVRGRIAAAGYGSGGTVWATENFAVGSGGMGIDEIMACLGGPRSYAPGGHCGVLPCGSGCGSDIGWTDLLHPAGCLCFRAGVRQFVPILRRHFATGYYSESGIAIDHTGKDRHTGCRRQGLS